MLVETVVGKSNENQETRGAYDCDKEPSTFRMASTSIGKIEIFYHASGDCGW